MFTTATTAPAVWSAKESRAWKWPARLTVSQWAARCRVLPDGVTPEPGPWSNERTPYLPGVMNAIHEPGVEEVVFVKPTQVGGSEALRNIIGYWIECDPGPTLIVMPDEKSAKEVIEERVTPMLMASPSLRKHLSDRAWDKTSLRIRLDTMDLYVAWAGSPQSLASRPCRYVVFDETDKYPQYSGREADPISLGEERTSTFSRRRRILKISTPTTRDGAIWKAFDSCGDKRYFRVPCPHCGHFQRLVWPQVKYAKPQEKMTRARWADWIEQGGRAWYECIECKGQIEDSQRLRMIQQGRWVGEGAKSKKIGLHLSSMYSPWRTFANAAAAWILADGDPSKTQNFYNSWLGEPFEVQVAKTQPSVIREKAVTAPDPRVIPHWAQGIIATADTQRDHFYWTIRAWGYEYKSQLIDRGIARSFDELYSRTLSATFPMVDINGVHQGFHGPQMLLIDSGGGVGELGSLGVSRTSEVYQFCLRDPSRIHPIKGANRSLNFVVGFHWQKEHGVQLWEIDTHQAKDLLTLLINDPDPTRWTPNRAVDDDYCTQMASEHKVIDPKTRKMEWKQKTGGAPNHFWDCEAYSVAAAMYLGAGQQCPAQPVTPVAVPQPQPWSAPQPYPSQHPSQPAGPAPFVNPTGGGFKVKNW